MNFLKMAFSKKSILAILALSFAGTQAGWFDDYDFLKNSAPKIFSFGCFLGTMWATLRINKFSKKIEDLCEDVHSSGLEELSAECETLLQEHERLSQELADLSLIDSAAMRSRITHSIPALSDKAQSALRNFGKTKDIH